MHIIFLIHRLSYSGAPKMLTWVANKMAEFGHQVEVVAFFSEDRMQILNENVLFHSLKVKQSKSRLNRNTLGMLETIKRLHKYISKQDPDLIVSFLDSVGYVYLLLNRFFGRRNIIISERADPSQFRGINAQIRFLAMNCSAGIVYQTTEAMNICKERVKKSGVVIPNPVLIDYAKRRNLPQIPVMYNERDNRVVSVGRLSLVQKRQDVMIDAFSIVHEKHPEMQLYIYGDGDDKNHIQNLIKSQRLEECIHLAGRITNVEETIYNARAFIITSDFEGIPNALIEAMTIGVPSIATDCSPGGAALLIKDGINAFLVKCGDVKMVAERLNVLIENEGLSNIFSKEGPQISDIFSEKTISIKWEEYLYEIKGKDEKNIKY